MTIILCAIGVVLTILQLSDCHMRNDVRLLKDAVGNLPKWQKKRPAWQALIYTMKVVAIQSTNSAIARPQVTFSMKSVDLAAPNI